MSLLGFGIFEHFYCELLEFSGFVHYDPEYGGLKINVSLSRMSTTISKRFLHSTCILTKNCVADRLAD